MKYTVFVLALFATANVYADCPYDLSGVSRDGSTLVDEDALPDFIACHQCRTLQDFPQDFRNSLWNEANTGSSYAQIAFDKMTTRSLYSFAGSTEHMTQPVCNNHGQCASVTIRVNYTALIGRKGLVNTGIENIEVTVYVPNGNDVRTRYEPNRIGDEFSVPSSNTADTHEKGACLTNQNQDTSLQDPSPTPNPEYNDYYERWWDEEAAYGGRHPEYSCNYVIIDDTSITRSCGWVWF